MRIGALLDPCPSDGAARNLFRIGGEADGAGEEEPGVSLSRVLARCNSMNGDEELLYHWHASTCPRKLAWARLCFESRMRLGASPNELRYSYEYSTVSGLLFSEWKLGRSNFNALSAELISIEILRIGAFYLVRQRLLEFIRSDRSFSRGRTETLK